jgi:glycosyltransferase involved in cell wall biosynthesis
MQFIKFLKKIRQSIRPKLGGLNHHAPKPLWIPKYYYQKSSRTDLPTISIVTPSFKQGQFIERTIKSVLDQEYPHLEYIVQDGGSKDSTVEVLKNYSSQLKHWSSQSDKGQSNAINLGFKHASGDIMAYLNSDDLLLPGSLHYIGEYFATHPEIDVVYGHRVLIDRHDQEIGRWVLPPHDHDILTAIDFIPQETLFWRRNIWDKAGGKIDENFEFAMDWDLILRFKDAGATFKRLPRFLGAFRVHPQQKTLVLMTETGKKEMNQLQARYHTEQVSLNKIQKKINIYLKKHVIYHQLYKTGLLKY